MLLSLMMVLTLLPLTAFAAADGSGGSPRADFSTEGLAELSTGAMKAYVDQKFPRVVRYVLHPGASDEIIVDGQTEVLDTVRLNGVDVKPVVTGQKSTDGKTMTYTLTVDEKSGNTAGNAHVIKMGSDGKAVRDEDDKLVYEDKTVDTELNVKITARIVVGDDGDNTLAFYIDKVEYLKDDRMEHPLETIEIPNHSLVSLSTDGTDQSVAVTGGVARNTSVATSDKTVFAHDMMGKSETMDFFAGFLHNSKVSASLASNSEYTSNNRLAGCDNNPVRAVFSPSEDGKAESIGLGSTLWYYDRKVSSLTMYDADVLKDTGSYPTLGEWELHAIPEEDMVKEPTELPLFAKVVITDKDENGDGVMDWQDGAIAYRGTIMHIPINSELVREAVNMRISMNFGGQAQHPFLMALDNVKRVALHTDGLGQLVLLKGYASEGHDSGHPDYWNIGERMGGVEDMITMMEEGGTLGAQFGIHVNCSEFYPEAEAFDENRVGRDSEGNLRYGWNWIDQGVNMNVAYDFATGDRAERFQKLYDLIGDRLSFVYVDVWGNGQHKINEDAWMTRQLTKEITEGREWRMTQEWSFANPYDSTFQHWTSDYTYGDYSYKGWLNSAVLRFLLNGYKDSFPADFPTYGGACNAPLLGGPAMQGFEGWQKDDEYDLSIYNTYNQMVPTKFLQHYDIMQWTNADNAVTMPYSKGANGERVESAEWTPEMQIVLQSGEDKVVVTRGLDAELDAKAVYSADDETEYRSRVITLNGKVILTGAPASAGEDPVFPKDKATLKYLIPWYWDSETGERFSADNEKLYHWNAQGGASTWDLPNGWENLKNVIAYEMSDQGRGEAQTLTVTDGKVSFPASTKANTAYVVVKGEANQGPEITYSTGMHVEDAYFNVDMANSPWTSTGSTSRETNPGGISALKLDGAASVSQVMTDLKAGQKYVTYVGVDNMSDGKASVTITDEDGEVLASNYTMRSIAQNYISAYPLHTLYNKTTGGFYADRTSRFQNMYIFFTPEEGKTYTITLSHEGEGQAYFAGVRTLETEADNFTYDEDGNATGFFQDFENVAQGIYPFVVSGYEGVEDNRIHLSELHAPYTQAGWDVRKLDDVIGGEWSIKINGLTSGVGQILIQTIPQNFRFEPGKTYTVEFDYELGTQGSYYVAIGEGECDYDAYGYPTSVGCMTVDLPQTLNKDHNFKSSTGTAKAPVGHAKFTVVGAQSGQTWIAIISDKDADTQGTSGNAANFGGYQDFVLDNLRITLNEADKSELYNKVELASRVDVNSCAKADGYTGTAEEAKGAFTKALAEAKAMLNDPNATDVQAMKDACGKLAEAMANIKPLPLVDVAVNRAENADGVNIQVVASQGETLVNAKIPTNIPSQGKTWSDLPASHWAAEAVDMMSSLNILNGVGGDRFAPNGKLNRAMLATALFRLSNGSKGFNASFTDVANGQWYTDAVAWANKVGVVQGYDNGTFQPAKNVTRQEIAAMLYRYGQLVDVGAVGFVNEADKFEDAENIGSWAHEAMCWCVVNGILTGKGDGTVLDPTAPATRAEVAVMLQRFVELMR